MSALRAVATRALERVQRVLPAAETGATILVYHVTDARSSSPVDLDGGVFRAQLELLAARGGARPLDRALASAEHSVVLTFDDAYANFSERIWPLLRELALPATLYVPVGFIDGTRPAPIRGVALPACGWDDLRAMAREGLTIGSHSLSHVDLRKLGDAELDRELGESRQRLEQELGVPVTSFCYPQAKWDRRVAEAARRHYATAVVGGGRLAHAGSDRLLLPRFPVRRDLADFERLIAARVWLSEAASDLVRRAR